MPRRTAGRETRVGPASSAAGVLGAAAAAAQAAQGQPATAAPPSPAPCRPWELGERAAWLWAVTPRSATEKLALVLRRWRADPVLFAFEALRTALTPYQAQMLLDLADSPDEVYAHYGLDPSYPKRQVLAPSGHGLGKTRVLAVAIWWHKLCHRSSMQLCTAPTGDQLTVRLWGEVRKLYRRLDANWPELAADWEVQTASIVHKDPRWGDWITVARTSRADKPEGLQGAHAMDEDDLFGDLARAHGDAGAGAHGGGILVVVDEASGVDDAVREVLTGALSEAGARLIAAGNPTRNDGWFAEDVTKRRHRYAVHHLDCRLSDRREVYQLPYRRPDGVVVPVRIRGFVEPRYWEDVLAECDGDEEHDRFRVRVRGLVPRANEEQVIRPEWVEHAQARDADTDSARLPVVLGLDFGLTSDKHALAVRQGYNVLDLAEWLPPGTPEEVLNEAFRRAIDAVAAWRAAAPAHAQPQVTVVGDSNGVGAGVMARLSDHYRDDAGVVVIHFNSGHVALDASRYHRRRDELWHKHGRVWLANPRTSLPRHPGLSAQFTAPTASEDTARKIKVESKDKIEKRTGQKSGNAADAILHTLAVPAREAPAPRPVAPPQRPKLWEAHLKRLDAQRGSAVFIR